MRGVRSQNYTKYKILSAEQEKGITSEFLLSYILPLFAFDFTRWVSVFEFLIYFVILAFLCVRNNNVYANLLFEIKRYKFYTCEMQWVAEPDTTPISMMVISKKPLTAHKGNTIEVAALNKPFYLSKWNWGGWGNFTNAIIKHVIFGFVTNCKCKVPCILWIT